MKGIHGTTPLNVTIRITNGFGQLKSVTSSKLKSVLPHNSLDEILRATIPTTRVVVTGAEGARGGQEASAPGKFLSVWVI